MAEEAQAAGMTKKEHALSKRMCGVGIVVSGILLLSVALIMGLDFPKYVYDKNLKDLCILNSSHRLYKDWVNDTFRDKFNRIYYWQLKNPDEFLYGEAFPQVQQRGPYVYREYETKQYVQYSYNKVYFYLQKWQVFDTSRTSNECGRQCTEDDLITILNPKYFLMVGKNGDVGYSLEYVPSIFGEVISDAMSLLNTDRQTLMTMLGRFSSQDLDDQIVNLGFPVSYTNLGFGSWVALDDTPFKRIVMQHRDSTDFTAREMSGLFTIITDKTLFGRAEDISSSDPSSATTMYPDCDLNAQLFRFSPTQDNTQKATLTYDTKAPFCTFLACLSKYMDYHVSSTNAARYLNNVTECISRYLCLSNTTSCFTLPLNPYVQNAYILTIYDYIHIHLSRYAFYRKVITSEEDIVITKKQSELALGHPKFNASQIQGDSDSMSEPLFTSILEHIPEKTDLYDKGKKISLYNCYDSVEARTNFDWKSFDEEDFIPQHYFPNASQEERKITSYWRNLAPIQELIACEETFVRDQDYAFFIPEYWRKLVFSPQQLEYLEDGLKSVLQVQKSMFSEVDGVFVNNEGLQTMDTVYNFRSWLSLPHFLYAGNLAQAYDMSPHEAIHLMKMAVEPVTGTMWESDVRYQLNIGILPSYVSIPRPRQLRLNSTDYPIPVYWVQRSFRYNEKGRAEFQDRTRRLLQAACGGLIGMSVIACITMIIGVLAATVTVRSGRVAPVENPETNGY